MPNYDVQYLGEFNCLIAGYIAEQAISPLTGKLRFRVVDFRHEASDPEAGKWVYASDCDDLTQPVSTANPAN